MNQEKGERMVLIDIDGPLILRLKFHPTKNVVLERFSIGESNHNKQLLSTLN